jgi:adenylate cyclase
VTECGGQPNQFVGDGLLALFGLATGPETACRQAIRAAAAIAVNVDELNRVLGHELREPIRFGIGIHGGEVIIGDIGYRDHIVFTALGDAVNVAARLQDMTKTLGCEVVLSDDVRKTARLSLDAAHELTVTIRGRDEPMTVQSIADAETLSSVSDAGPVAA